MWQLVLGAAAGVGSLLPDLDTKASTASRSLGPITGLVSWAVRGASRLAYTATKGPADEPHRGEHRHLTHSLVVAVAVGLGVWALAGTWLPDMSLLLGAAVTAGMVAALCGDACTVSGVSGFCWPLPIRGETFYECYLLPPGLRIRTGKAAERVVFELSVVALVLLLPGMWPVMAEMWAAVR